MDVSIFLARVLGIYLVIVCFAVFFKFKMINAMMDELDTNNVLVMMSAIISLIIGILLFVAHPVFVANWRVLITLIGLLSLVKGIGLLFFPKYMIRFKSVLLTNASLYFGLIFLFFLIGIFLLYHGFLA